MSAVAASFPTRASARLAVCRAPVAVGRRFRDGVTTVAVPSFRDASRLEVASMPASSSSGCTLLARNPSSLRAASCWTRWEVVPGSVRACASAAGSTAGNKKEENQSESDRRMDESGEYDTQEHYKRVGNPISWANPTGGGTIEDNSSNAWRWVYPAGVVGILLLCLWSRRRNMRKEQEEQMVAAPQITMHDTSSFRYTPPTPPPSDYNQEEDSAPPPFFSGPPPASDGSFSFGDSGRSSLERGR